MKNKIIGTTGTGTTIFLDMEITKISGRTQEDTSKNPCKKWESYAYFGKNIYFF